MNWCWREGSGDTFISFDKWMHAVLHIIVTSVAYYVLGPWVAILVSETLGIVTEVVETTHAWDIFMKKVRNPIAKWLNNYFGWNLRMEGKSSCLSIKDIIVNQIGLIVGLIICGW